MKLFFELAILAILIFTFRAIRTKRINDQLDRDVQRKADRESEIAALNWMRADPADTRETRRLSIFGPSYTSYNETGTYKKPKIDAPSYATYNETGSYKKAKTGTYPKIS